MESSVDVVVSSDGFPISDGIFYYRAQDRGWILVDVRSDEAGLRYAAIAGDTKVFPTSRSGFWRSATVRVYKEYPVSFEIYGHTAFFLNPESAGTGAMSYDVPPYSASKGILERFAGVRSKEGVFFHPESVEVCFRPSFRKLSFNYNGAFRKMDLINEGRAHVQTFQALVDPVYVIRGKVLRLPYFMDWTGTTNAVHKYCDEIMDRCKKGTGNAMPCIGVGDCMAWNYCLPRKDTHPNEHFNKHLSQIRFSPYDRPINGRNVCSYMRNVEIKKGVMKYVWSYPELPVEGSEW